MREVWSLVGTVGAYADVAAWVAAVFTSREAADGWAAAANAWLVEQRLHSSTRDGGGRYFDYVGAEKAQATAVDLFDPRLQIDGCYGCSYAVEGQVPVGPVFPVIGIRQ